MPLTVHVQPADPTPLPPGVGAVARVTTDLDVHYDPTLPPAERCAYNSAALTAGMREIIDRVTHHQD